MSTGFGQFPGLPDKAKQVAELRRTAQTELGSIMGTVKGLEETASGTVGAMVLGVESTLAGLAGTANNAVAAPMDAIDDRIRGLEAVANQGVTSAVDSIRELCACIQPAGGAAGGAGGGAGGEPGEPEPEEPKPEEPEGEEPEGGEPEEPEEQPDIGNDPNAPNCDAIPRECPVGFSVQDDPDNACGWSCLPDDPLVVSCPPGFTGEYDAAGNLIACHPDHSTPEPEGGEPEEPEEEPEEPEEEESEEEEEAEPGEQKPIQVQPTSGSQPVYANPRCEVDAWVSPATSSSGASRNLANWAGDVGNKIVEKANEGMGDRVLDTLVAFGGAATIGFSEGASGWVDGLLAGLGIPASCIPTWAAKVTSGFAAHWLTDDIRYLTMPNTYFAQQCFPVLFPTASEAARAYLGNEIDETILESWVTINGQCWKPFERVVNSMRTKLSPTDVVVAFMRGIFDETQYNKRIRELGYLRDEDADVIKQLAQQVPPVSELIRYMVRDVGDDTLVSRFGMDDQFEQKWAGDVKKWSEQQGVGQEFARASWRAHWTIPSPTQLFTMYHRLRYLDGGNPAKVNDDDIRTALVQQDILPFWIDKYLAISFNPLTRVDVRRMYEIGAIDRDGVRRAYLDNGYNDENANRLTEFTDRLRRKAVYNHIAVGLWKAESISRQEAESRIIADGVPEDTARTVVADVARRQRNHRLVQKFRSQRISRGIAESGLNMLGYQPSEYERWLDDAEDEMHSHPLLSLYERQSVTETELRREFERWGYKLPTVNRLIGEVQIKITAGQRDVCLKAIRRRAITGEFDEGRLRDVLQGIFGDGGQVDRLVSTIECVRSATGKIPPTATLCRWAELGAIDDLEFYNRLQRIGWSSEDASNILSDCRAKISVKRQREAEQLARRSLQEQLRRQRAADRTAKELERLEKKTSDMRIRAQKAADRRESAIAKAALSMSQRYPLDLAELIGLLRRVRLSVQAAYQLTADEAVQATVLASESYGLESLDGFAAYADSVANSMVQAQEIPVVTVANGTPIT